MQCRYENFALKGLDPLQSFLWKTLRINKRQRREAFSAPTSDKEVKLYATSATSNGVSEICWLWHIFLCHKSRDFAEDNGASK
ncbi:unnamed protein product, partial [Ceratitis capitata]